MFANGVCKLNLQTPWHVCKVANPYISFYKLQLLMDKHRFILEPYKGALTRYYCPRCENRKKTFARYIDSETGKQINPTVGRCNRESNCGYHYTPRQYFQDNNFSIESPLESTYNKKLSLPKVKPITYIPIENFKNTFKYYEHNNFVKFLSGRFGSEVTSQLVSRYLIGTSRYWQGATVFWQVDLQGNIRTGKIMLYSPTTGKRIKEPYNHITWAHKALKLPEFELNQCLYGEHLLSDSIKPIAIVESEKTAVIASIYLPQFNWLAVGSLANLTLGKCIALNDRDVVLFPDLNGFDKWSQKAKELSNLANFKVSTLLESKAASLEKHQGLDLADYLLRFDYRGFHSEDPASISVNKPIRQTSPAKLDGAAQSLRSAIAKSASWDSVINELAAFFNSIILPDRPIKLDQFSTINNVHDFVQNHFETIKVNNGKKNFLPYLERLQNLKVVLTEKIEVI